MKNFINTTWEAGNHREVSILFNVIHYPPLSHLLLLGRVLFSSTELQVRHWDQHLRSVTQFTVNLGLC